MRALSSRTGLLLSTFLLIALSTGLAHAQSEFDDEFDAEFNDPEPAEEAAPASDPASSDPAASDPASSDPASDAYAPASDPLFGDDFDTSEEDASLEEAEEAPAPSRSDEAEERARLMRTHNSYYGPTGGLRVVDAAGGAVGSFRLQLIADFFVISDLINTGDSASHVGGSLSLSWTPHKNIELWASMQSSSNYNDSGDPQLFQVLGDTQLGIKAFFNIGILSLGGDVSLSLLNRVGDIGLIFKGTSVGIRANATLDLQRLENSIPFVARLNLQYYFDNSANLISDVESTRYNNLPDANPNIEFEDRHLLTSVERFALNINRTDFFSIALGLEAPIAISDSFAIHPLLEWEWKIPVNRQGYSCLEPGSSSGDSCLTLEGAGAFPMDLTLGVRVLPPVPGLSFLVAADVGLTGARTTFVRELAPNALYNIYLGASYAYDTRAPEPAEPEVRIVEREVEVAMDGPLEGRIAGQVIETGTSTPVAGATIRFPNHELTALYGGQDGRFTTYRFAPGEVMMEISHPEYEPGRCAATIPEERPESGELEVPVTCELVALPRVGAIRGTVVSGEGGQGVSGATVTLSGPGSANVTTGPDGVFHAENLAPGSYTARVDAEDFLIKTESIVVEPRGEATPTITMVPRPRQALVRVRNRDIQIRRQINFATDSAEILPSSEALMAEIADVMIRNPQITQIEIQGHTDNRGAANHNLDLSQRRADSVRTWLTSHGVESSRLTARGYGQAEPLVPNITPANRARNRRVQFMIIAQQDAE